MSDAEDSANEQYEDKPILSVEQNLERLRKIKEKRLETIDKTTPTDVATQNALQEKRKAGIEKPEIQGFEGSQEPVSEEELPEYPFKEGGQTKKEPKKPQPSLPFEEKESE
jgi:hypothetical protein